MSDVESRTVVEEQLQENAEPDVTETVIEPKKKTRKPKTAKQMEAFEKMVAAKKAKQSAKPAKKKKVVMNIIDAPSGSESEEEVVVKRNKRKPSKKRRKKRYVYQDSSSSSEEETVAVVKRRKKKKPAPQVLYEDELQQSDQEVEPEPEQVHVPRMPQLYIV